MSDSEDVPEDVQYDAEAFADWLGLTLEGEVSVRGVFFLEFTDDAGDTRYHLHLPNGRIHEQSLSEVYADGNYTMARTRHGDLEVMVDDDGVHRNWE